MDVNKGFRRDIFRILDLRMEGQDFGLCCG